MEEIEEGRTMRNEEKEKSDLLSSAKTFKKMTREKT